MVIVDVVQVLMASLHGDNFGKKRRILLTVGIYTTMYVLTVVLSLNVLGDCTTLCSL